MRCVKLFLCIVIFILVSSLCYAAQVEDLVFDSLDSDGEVDVIVVLKDTSAIETANKFVVQAKAENKFNVLENKKKEIKKNQDKVLNKHKNFKAKHVYSTINAFSGKVDSATLADLQNDPDVERVLFDKSLKIQLTDSVPLISADDVWKRQINGFNITGKGVGVCVIDSGIDYTHESLGACSPTQLTLGGNNESYVLESIHPYANSFDYMWKITKQGYNNISVHFQNISLEYPGQDGYDTADRILIYNSNKEQIAVYHGAAGGLADIWTPYSEGDTIYIRLVTDGSVTDYGFYIDETRNGTTDTSYDWSACKKVIGGWDFINNDGLPMDDNGHGTHVAGIVAANGSVIGVAPEASLVAIKSMDSSGSGQDSNIAAGIDWCVNNSLVHNISVITMSIGGGGPYTDLNCPVNAFLIEASLQSAHQAGIFVAIASGNDGFSNGLSYPACSPYAISVGATDKSDNMASYSNTGSNLDLVAPGSSIISTKVGGGSYLNSGTSMACPHVAGVAALIMQERNELGLIAYGHDRLEELMKNSSLVNVTDVYDFPRVEAYRALNDACDGADSSYRNTTYYYDSDLDAYGNSSVTLDYCFLPWSYIDNSNDCDDFNSSINPLGSEILCDGIDQDCSGADLNGTDNDLDGYMVEGGYCGLVDCNDTNSSINPGAYDVPCDGVDQDCSGADLNGTDADSDGYMVEGGLCGAVDCNDINVSINPDATEIACDGIDQDCSGADLNGTDNDLDGYMLEGGFCGLVDCNDTNSSINPGVAESVCDGMDDNCDGNVDENLTTIYYYDFDNDTYGNATDYLDVCSIPSGYVSDNQDCNDALDSVAPNASETLNGVDDNCNGFVDEGLVSGNATDIFSTTFTDINVTVNATDELNQTFEGDVSVVINADNNTAVEFTFDFDNNYLNLSAIVIERQTGNDSGSVIISGVNLSEQGGTKTVYLDDLNKSVSGVCIKDAEISSITEISDYCNGTNEFSIDCSSTGYTLNGYTCTDLGGRLKIEGLNNSGVKEFEACTDIDGDGYGVGCALGVDCDDTDESVNPGETEVCGDGIDNDCDGSDSACRSSSSGGGGGGGGGASYAGNYSATGGSSETRYFVSIEPNKEVSMDIVRDELSVIKTSFKSKSAKEVVKLKVAKKDSLPSNVPSVDDVHEYIEVLTEGIEDSDISEAKIEFAVSKSFVKDGYEVVLKRYESEWVDLETELIDSDSDYFYYSAVTPGFSYFAISLKQAEVVIEEVVDEVEDIVIEIGDQEVFTTQESVEDLEPVVEQPVNDRKSLWFGLVIVLIAFLVIYEVSGGNKKLKKKNRKLFT